MENPGHVHLWVTTVDEIEVCSKCGTSRPARVGNVTDCQWQWQWLQEHGQCNDLIEWHNREHKGCPPTLSPSMPQSYLPGLGTIRECIDCGCLIAGGPTRCKRCAKEVK
jgi:hypothetical protein